MRAAGCQEKTHCRKSYCLIARTAYIYGLYDVRVDDIFYVGSTYRPGERFADHLSGAREPYNYKSLWLQNILESGSYPLLLSLYAFQTECETYTRQVEGEIARQLQAEGHTALWDAHGGPTSVNAYMQQTYPYEQFDWRMTRPVEVNLWREHIDQIAEQARVFRMLREMYLYG